MREFNFDGLVGPTHNYGGLSAGNVASMSHGGDVSRPRDAVLQGIKKMRFVDGLGVGQGVLPPHDRPSMSFLRSVGFRGSDEAVIAAAADAHDGHLLRVASSAAAMWTANAATVAPSSDTVDGKLHLVPANLSTMAHRAVEAPVTKRVLERIFSDDTRFAVHTPLPSSPHFADEGAANHTRLFTDDHDAVHLFAWGRHGYASTDAQRAAAPKKHPARQTMEASSALARLLQLTSDRSILVHQDPRGIDDGAFHTDVLAVGTAHLLLVHERAFVDLDGLTRTLREKLGDQFTVVCATEDELPAVDAVKAYPFNSQLIKLPDGNMVIVAPEDCRENKPAFRFLERVRDSDVGVSAIHTFDLKQSMRNGGGPACLRLRIPLTDDEATHLGARVLVDEALFTALEAFAHAHYRETMCADDLRDPMLWREVMTALDALTSILQMGSVYDFQRAGSDVDR